MPTTSPDNIWFTDDSTTSSLDSITAGIASSVQNALNDRSWRNYTWADTGERTAQTGMTTGSLGRQLDDGTLWQYDGTNWVRLFVSSNSYETLAALNMVTGYNGQKATVWNDPNPANNGDYVWDGSAWERPYPRIATGQVRLSTSAVGNAAPIYWANWVTVTFPTTVNFTARPRIFVSSESPAGRVDSAFQIAEESSTTSFQVRPTRVSTGFDQPIGFNWLAIQETP